mmetsp:Transcript_14903/g.39936  ORF Transcript_14903/g.39936 Transcript_14903/m.39936 type:complete len:302 (-) Transcript_14903:2583-3488(-)
MLDVARARAVASTEPFLPLATAVQARPASVRLGAHHRGKLVGVEAQLLHRVAAQEITRVLLAKVFRNELGFLVAQIHPVDTGKVRVLLQLFCAVSADARARIRVKQPLQQIERLGAHLVRDRGPLDRVVEDVFKDALGRSVMKRRNAHHELVQNDAERPPIRLVAVAGPQQNLRSKIVWRAANLAVLLLLRGVVMFGAFFATRRHGEVMRHQNAPPRLVLIKHLDAHCFGLDQFQLRQTEINQLQVAVAIDDQIVGLEVTMNNADLVQVLQGENGLSHVLPRDVLVQKAEIAQQRVDVATR